MAGAFPQYKCPEAQKVYIWQECCVFPRFPQPLSLKAARALIKEECFIAGYPEPVVRSNFLKRAEYAHIAGGVDQRGRIYLREWSNKGVVLHELAHYFTWCDNLPMEHDATFMRHFLRLLGRAGATDLEAGVRAYGVPF